jgi:hypothetical protein
MTTALFDPNRSSLAACMERIQAALKPKLRDLEHVNLHYDLGKCRRQRSHVLTTRHRPERRPSRPVKIIDTQRCTRSARAPGPSVYVLRPISGVFPGHCPFSADTPT